MGNADLILWIFLAAAGIAIAIMVLLANIGSHSPLSQAAVSERGYHLRRYWFGMVMSGAVLAFVLTIPHFPYAAARTDSTAKHFPVVAQQYGFLVAQTIPLNQTVVFDVTSKDVNHGFGIYAPDGSLVGQVQAMPEYVNHLAMTFRVPGHYTLRCMEYCGIAHSAMQGGFDVR